MGDAPRAVVKAALPPRQERFCQLLLTTDNGAEAARGAGYSERRAKRMAYDLLQIPAVQARIAELRAERSERLEITADAVLEELWAIAKADPRELIEYRVGACRFCHGEGHKYQRTPHERATALAKWDARPATNREAFDELGGVGYDRSRAPHPGCPECNGLGEGFTLVKDQRDISPAAARLLAGVKETKEGIEVKMHNPQDALVTVGKHLGMFTDRIDHTTNGQPLPPAQLTVAFVKAQG